MSSRSRLFAMLAGAFALLLFSSVRSFATAESINFGSAEGILYYSSNGEVNSGTCGTYEHLYHWQEFTFSGFSYTDPNGVSWPFSTTAVYFVSASGQGCPPSGGKSVTLGASGFSITFTPVSTTSGTATISFQGSVAPKYAVTSVYYAPPGSKSYADYSQTTMVGSSTTFSNSLSSSATLTVSLGETFNYIFGTASLSGTSSSTIAQEADSSISVDMFYQNGAGARVNGPASDAAGLDNHNEDVFAVWLNPVVNLGLSSTHVNWKNYNFDGRDDAANLELVYPYCWELESPGQIPQYLRDRFNKAWDTSGLGGLTNSDFATIAAQNPYCVNPGLNSVDSTRYQGPVNGSTIPYQPPPPGGQPFTWYWNTQYQLTNTHGQGASVSYSTGFSTSASYSIFGGLWSSDLKTSNSLTSTNKWSSLETQRTTQAATVSVTSPAYGSGYTGPGEFNMYQDNIYGTYMFFPVQ